MATHYCDDCTSGRRHEGDEWCCGGDGQCDCVEAEPECTAYAHHVWTPEGTGGCDTNPGVWSLGGTTYRYAHRCRLCGCGRSEVERGTQRNPGECDTVRYSPGAYRPDEDADRQVATLRQRDQRNARRRAARAEKKGAMP